MEGNPSVAEGGQADGRRRSTRLRRWAGAAAVLLVALVLLLGDLAAAAALPFWDSLRRAQEDLQRARQALLANDPADALASFRKARAAFGDAGRRARAGPLLPLAWLPLAGRTPDALAALAVAGADVALAGEVLSGAVAELPGGLSALAPRRGHLPLDYLPSLATALEKAEAFTGQAVATLAGAPRTPLPGPVATALHEAEQGFEELHRRLALGARIARRLPTFLGAEGPRRYFVAAQNPAELRGTGGILGAYAILLADGGTLRLGPFRPIQSLPLLDPHAVEAPNSDYARNYDQFRGGRRFWTAINVMPDFPSVARAILAGYAAATGERLDGVIAADPFALQALLRATGPAPLPGYGLRITAENVVAFTANRAYGLFPDHPTRKRVLGDVARQVIARFMSQPAPSFGDLRLLLRSIGEGHLLVYAEDPELEAALAGSVAGGALRPGPGDFLAVVVNSAAGSKVDYYQDRRISYAVRLGDDGSARVQARVTLENRAPVRGQPRYVIGPWRPTDDDGRVGPILEHLEAGQSVVLVHLYCRTGCPSAASSLNGKPTRVWIRSDLGLPYLQAYFPIESGETATLDASWEAKGAWQGDDRGGTYRLTFANQVTIRPTWLRVEIHPPGGMRITRASPPLRLERDIAVYEGRPNPRLALEVRFAPPAPLRLWRALLHLLTRPVVRL